MRSLAIPGAGRLLAAALLLTPGLLVGGCGGAAQRAEETMPLPERPLEIVACASGERVEPDAMLDALLAVRAIYVGERHDQAFDHRVQREVIAGIHGRDPSLAIGMEMFQHPFQAPLDAYLAGSCDEPTLLAGTEWRERWNLDFGLYRSILEYARANGVPVIALNARRELTRAIAREGLDALSPELRAELPELDTSDAEHRAMIEEALGGHEAMDAARLERFYLAQLTWDESMGARAAASMGAPDAPHRIVVLAGRMHVQRGLGIPRRAARRGLEPFRVVLPLTREELAESRGLCDYAVIAPG